MADFELILATETVPTANLHADPHHKALRALRALRPAVAGRSVVVAATDEPTAFPHHTHPVVVTRQTLAGHRDMVSMGHRRRRESVAGWAEHLLHSLHSAVPATPPKRPEPGPQSPQSLLRAAEKQET